MSTSERNAFILGVAVVVFMVVLFVYAIATGRDSYCEAGEDQNQTYIEECR